MPEHRLKALLDHRWPRLVELLDETAADWYRFTDPRVLDRRRALWKELLTVELEIESLMAQLASKPAAVTD
jgi:hypothetical protein